MQSAANSNILLGIGVGALLIVAGFVWFLTAGGGLRTGSWAYVEQDGISFRYPEVIGTSYVRMQAWPPVVQIVEGPLVCASEVSERELEVQTKTIGKRVYCIFAFVGAAAGSVYTEYKYSTEVGRNKVVILTFTIRTPQCANYATAEEAACREEHKNFNIDPVIDGIVDTI